MQLTRLTSADIPLMRGMLAMFGRAFDDQDSYGAAPPSDVYLQNLLGKADFIALAAIEDGQVIGGFCAYILQKFEQERSEIYIYDLAVAEDFRRCGAATALIERIRRIGAESGAGLAFVQADREDEPAIALYGKVGIQKDVAHFDIPISAKGAST